MSDGINSGERQMQIDPVQFGQLLERIDTMHDDIKEIKKDVKTQNSRVGKLENWKSYVIGGWAVFLVALGLVVKFWR